MPMELVVGFDGAVDGAVPLSPKTAIAKTTPKESAALALQSRIHRVLALCTSAKVERMNLWKQKKISEK